MVQQVIDDSLAELASKSQKHYYDMQKLLNACLFCSGDLIGNEVYGYYCEECKLSCTKSFIENKIPIFINQKGARDGKVNFSWLK